LGLTDVVIAAALNANDVEQATTMLQVAMNLDPYDQERPLRVARMLTAAGRTVEVRTLAAEAIAAATELGVPWAVEWDELTRLS